MCPLEFRAFHKIPGEQEFEVALKYKTCLKQRLVLVIQSDLDI